MDNILTESQKIIQKSINYYFEKMRELHKVGFEDEEGPDIEDWAAAEFIINNYVNGEEPNKEELLIYLGDLERVELVLSYYNIAKYLLSTGATIEI